MKSRPARDLVALLLSCPALAGCMSFKPEWNSTASSARPASRIADADLALAREASRRAVDAEGLPAAMAAYEKVLIEAPIR